MYLKVYLSSIEVIPASNHAPEFTTESRIVLVYSNNFPTFGIFSVTILNGTIDRIIYGDSGQSCPGI